MERFDWPLALEGLSFEELDEIKREVRAYLERLIHAQRKLRGADKDCLPLSLLERTLAPFAPPRTNVVKTGRGFESASWEFVDEGVVVSLCDVDQDDARLIVSVGGFDGRSHQSGLQPPVGPADVGVTAELKALIERLKNDA